MTPLSLPLILTTLRTLARPVTTAELAEHLRVSPNRLPMYLRVLSRRGGPIIGQPVNRSERYRGACRYWWHRETSPPPNRRPPRPPIPRSTLGRMAKHLGIVEYEPDQIYGRVWEATDGCPERWRTVRESVST